MSGKDRTREAMRHEEQGFSQNKNLGDWKDISAVKSMYITERPMFLAPMLYGSQPSLTLLPGGSLASMGKCTHVHILPHTDRHTLIHITKN